MDDKRKVFKVFSASLFSTYCLINSFATLEYGSNHYSLLLRLLIDMFI